MNDNVPKYKWNNYFFFIHKVNMDFQSLNT
jgi:hypothetical protein